MLLVAPKGHWQEQVVHVPKVVQQERQHHFHVEDGADFCCDCWGFFSDVFFSRKRNTQKWRNPWECLNMNEYVLMFLPRKCKWSVTCLRCPGCTPLFFSRGILQRPKTCLVLEKCFEINMKSGNGTHPRRVWSHWCHCRDLRTIKVVIPINLQ